MPTPAPPHDPSLYRSHDGGEIVCRELAGPRSLVLLSLRLASCHDHLASNPAWDGLVKPTARRGKRQTCLDRLSTARLSNTRRQKRGRHRRAATVTYPRASQFYRPASCAASYAALSSSAMAAVLCHQCGKSLVIWHAFLGQLGSNCRSLMYYTAHAKYAHTK